MIKYLVFNVFIVAAQCSIGYDYYWRDYEGYMPYDAVPAGHDLYIAQHIYKCFLVPGTFYPENRTFVGEYWGKFEVTSDIKILCSPNHDQFKWVTIENSTTPPPNDVNCKPVLGGYEYSNFNFRWYIGKAFHEGMWKISKVDFTIIKGLSMWNSNGSYEQLKNFEMLKVCSKNMQDDKIYFVNSE